MKLLRQIRQTLSQKRKGYFILFFAVLITMLMVPIMNQVLIETVETRDGLTSYQKSSNMIALGNSVLKAKLEELSEKGLGYAETGSVEIEGGVVSYEFSSTSTTPVPTSKTLNDLYGTLEPPLLGDSVDLYTVPALGTGSAGSDCEMGVVKEDYYPGTDELIDQLDHPCNWNILKKGENVGIPLYTQPAELADSEAKYRVEKPGMMLLRVRLHCKDEAEFCLPEERLVFWDESFMDGESYPGREVRANNPEFDFTNKVIDWVFQGNGVYVPNTLSDINGKDPLNREISVVRLLNSSEDNTFEFYDALNKVSSMDLARIRGFDILDQDKIFTSALELLSPFGIDVTDEIGPWDLSENLPELVFGFTKNRILSCENSLLCRLDCFFGGTCSLPSESEFMFVDLYDVYDLEYQLITDVRLANDKFVIKGDLSLGDENYALDIISKPGPEADTPASVFST